MKSCKISYFESHSTKSPFHIGASHNQVSHTQQPTTLQGRATQCNLILRSCSTRSWTLYHSGIALSCTYSGREPHIEIQQGNSSSCFPLTVNDIRKTSLSQQFLLKQVSQRENKLIPRKYNQNATVDESNDDEQLPEINTNICI